MELKLNEEMLQNKDMDAAYVEAPHDIKGFFGGIVEGAPSSKVVLSTIS